MGTNQIKRMQYHSALVCYRHRVFFHEHKLLFLTNKITEIINFINILYKKETKNRVKFLQICSNIYKTKCFVKCKKNLLF